MTALSLWIALAIAAAPPTDREATFDGITKVRYVDLTSGGKATLNLGDGTHRVVVTLTLAGKPRGWPEEFVIGPTSDELGNQTYRIVIDAEISVDGCRIYEPWPPIRGMSVPDGAALSGQEGRWKLQIFGGDGAESYGVTYTFDKRRILTRELGWGPDYTETTHYDIQVDPDVSPQQCT